MCVALVRACIGAMRVHGWTRGEGQKSCTHAHARTLSPSRLRACSLSRALSLILSVFLALALSLSHLENPATHILLAQVIMGEDPVPSPIKWAGKLPKSRLHTLRIRDLQSEKEGGRESDHDIEGGNEKELVRESHRRDVTRDREMEDGIESGRESGRNIGDSAGGAGGEDCGQQHDEIQSQFPVAAAAATSSAEDTNVFTDQFERTPTSATPLGGGGGRGTGQGEGGGGDEFLTTDEEGGRGGKGNVAGSMDTDEGTTTSKHEQKQVK